MTPLVVLNHLIMSLTAASAAAILSRSPSLLLVSKNEAVGVGVSVRRYMPTLNVSARIDNHRR